VLPDPLESPPPPPPIDIGYAVPLVNNIVPVCIPPAPPPPPMKLPPPPPPPITRYSKILVVQGFLGLETLALFMTRELAPCLLIDLILIVINRFLIQMH
jgi:hypothetical protein